jgi:replicative DNA helicase
VLVSVTEIASRDEEFERTPPHDIAAEQCVLGSMLISKDAISDVVEVLRPQDHYRPAHQIVHEAILDLYSRGEPADAITVKDELAKHADLARMGGPPYLHTLISSVPTAANAGYYARIVRERAILRRLVEAGTRIVQLGYAGQGEADNIVDQAQAEVYGVTERRAGEDYLSLSEIMPGALDEIEAIGSRGGQMVGVPTGFADLDALTNGLHPGQMIVIAARPAIGKALALDTPLPTPRGWTTMAEVVSGDQLIGADGKPVTVVAATEVMHGRQCYEVEFSDGEVIVADAQHQWLTWTRAARRHGARLRGPGRKSPGQAPGVVTTEEIAATLRCGIAGRDVNHAVELAPPLDLAEAELPVPPYALGAWIAAGPGTPAQFSAPESGLAAASGLDRNPDRGHRGTTPVTAGTQVMERTRGDGLWPARLRALGDLGSKHIPASYLRASGQQRRDLLAGVLDTGGTVTSTGSIQLALASRRLARDVRELAQSLGYQASITTTIARSCTAGSPVCYLVNVTTEDQVFRLSQKNLLHRERIRSQPQRPGRRPRWRHIVDVRQVESRPVRCVQVDSPDGLFLAGRSMIPTHNSTLALDLARSAAIRNGLATVMFSLEMGRNEITMKLLSAESRVPLHTMRTGQMNDDDWTRLARRMSEVAEAPLFIDDSPNMSMMEIRAKCRRLKQRHDLRMVIVDYLQLMSSPKRVESRQQEVSEMSRMLKLLAKELDVPVIALSQLNRSPEQRNDKRPMLSDLRESGCLTAGTRVLRADTGAEVTLGELLASGERDVPVWSLDERLRLVARPMTHAFPSGVKEVFKVQLTSGREVHATASHPFLTYDGWRPLGELEPGSRVAVPRQVPDPLVTRVLPEPEIIMLGHLIGDGSFVRNQPIRYASVDEANLAAVTEAAKHFGVTAVRDGYEAARCTSLRLTAPHQLARGKRNPIADWLDGLGLSSLRSHEKFIPQPVFLLPRQQLALFLRHLWATDGCVWWDTKHWMARIYYASTSRRLVEDLAQLLIRFNVMTRIKEVQKAGYRPCYHLVIDGSENQLRFVREIGVHGDRELMAEMAKLVLGTVTGNTNLDTVPREVWNRVREVLAGRQMTHRRFAAAMGTKSCGSALGEHSPSRERLSRVATVLEDADLEMVATNDVFWDEVASVESIGEQPVYDATVTGTHNFIADGVNVHNSIEQDSDLVILLHREDAYERESPRAGEADLIVAKHRNGPTATVTVAFQGHYSRFVDMAPG